MEVEPAEEAGARHREGDGSQADGTGGSPQNVGSSGQKTHGNSVRQCPPPLSPPSLVVVKSGRTGFIPNRFFLLSVRR